METFTEPKELVENPHYQDQRQKSLAHLSDEMIDVPIIELIHAFNKSNYCFTLQSCYGHFMYNGQNDSHNLEPLPITDAIARVEYKIAFALLFFGIWITDSFFLKYTTQLNDIVPALVRKPIGILLLCLSVYCAWSGLRIVFSEVRETPSVIRKGVFGVVRQFYYYSII